MLAADLTAVSAELVDNAGVETFNVLASGICSVMAS
jgi:hypothetical protein